MKLIGIVLILLSFGSFMSPLIGIELPEIDKLPAPAKYAGSLIGGMLFGFARARGNASEPGSTTPVGMAGVQLCANSDCAQPVNLGHRFCTACGAPIEQSVPETTGCNNPACNAEVTGDMPFCTNCGWPVADQPGSAAAGDNVLRCPNSQCGEVIQSGQKFCTACGASLN